MIFFKNIFFENFILFYILAHKNHKKILKKLI